MNLYKTTEFVKYILEKRVYIDCIAIDATMGNGNDTLFLAKLVGSKGKVYSFDIQSLAIENTQKLLVANNIDPNSDNIKLILDGHENISKYINCNIDLAMFNLGYLPGGDHKVITKGESTINALKDIISLLNKGGLISIILYYAHEGGTDEKEEVLSFVEELDAAQYSVLKCENVNGKNHPPIVVLIEKK